LSSYFRCTSADAHTELPGSHLYRITPLVGDSQPTRPDWSAVLSVLGATPGNPCLQVSARLVRLAGEGVGLPVLTAEILVSAQAAVDDVVLHAIGQLILGGGSFEVSADIARSAQSAEFNGTAISQLQVAMLMLPPQDAAEGGTFRQPLAIPAVSPPMSSVGCPLGVASYAAPGALREFTVTVEPEARFKHVYVIGKTGSGKTNLLKEMVRFDIRSGHGVAIIDPHGDLAEYALGHCGERAAETIYLDFADDDFLPCVNPLSLDISTGRERSLAVEELLGLIARRGYSEWVGPRFETTVRMALDLLTAGKSDAGMVSLLDVGRVFRDQAFRKSLLDRAPNDSDVKDRWNLFAEMKPSDQAEIADWATSKFTELEKSAVLECVLAAQTASFSLRDCIRGGGIFIARLPEGIIGTRAASFLGSLFVSRISRHITERLPAAGHSGSSYYLYVDEFQKFVGHEFQQLIPEARKYRLGITLAHQNIDQLRAFDRWSGTTESSVLTQVLGNAGTIIAFKMAHRDAERIGQELGLTTSELLRIKRFEAVVRTVRADAETDPITVAVPDALEDPGYPAARQRVRESLRARGVIRSRAALLGVDLTDDMLASPKSLGS
jgi:hypothetical protein